MAGKLRLPAPAKLNLMLQITGRRDDGYHLLETVFQFIELYDWIEFGTRADGRVERGVSHTPVAAQEDILIRSANLLKQRFEVEVGVDIAIEKNIPVGGGLGGGSSDAATCLLALNRLWRLGLGLDQLAEIGLEIGADVPVFVRGFAAWASGVGEQLEPIELERPFYLVIDPKIEVSTAQIFAAQELTRNCDPLTIRAFLRGAGTNVCEPVVRSRYPEVAAAIDWLNRFAPARMSGTGSCIFAACDSLEHAEEVKLRVPEKWGAFVARGLNRNPLHRQLEMPV